MNSADVLIVISGIYAVISYKDMSLWLLFFLWLVIDSFGINKFDFGIVINTSRLLVAKAAFQ